MSLSPEQEAKWHLRGQEAESVYGAVQGWYFGPENDKERHPLQMFEQGYGYAMNKVNGKVPGIWTDREVMDFVNNGIGDWCDQQTIDNYRQSLQESKS
jgi:hypothetical protein